MLALRLALTTSHRPSAFRSPSAKLTGAGPVGLRLLAGPVLSLKANESLSTTGLLGVKLDTDQIKSSDMGMAFGAAAAIQNGNMKLVAEGRYTLGMSNVSKLPFGGDVKNGAIYATAGIEFPFGTP